MWWPSPEALDDLKIEENEGGFVLEAPVGSECAEWINHWNQSEEHEKFFNEQFVQMLTNYINTLDGKNQVQSHE